MVFGIAAMAIGTIVAPLLIVGLILMAWVAWTFSVFNITVTTSHLEWWFRGGFWHKKIPLSDIEQARPVRNRWWYGWGIHLTPRGWLYNVQGLSAVEIVTKAGHRFRIGTEEPEELAEAIARLRSPPAAR